MELKYCKKCSTHKPLAEFANCRSSKDGRYYSCKACQRASAKAWQTANRERAIAARRQWHAANKDRSRAVNRKWREDNPNAGAKWKAANPEKVKASRRRYYRENRERCLASNKQWQEDNKEYIRDYFREYRKNNPDKLNQRNATRRAKKINATPAWVDQRYVALFYALAQRESERTGRTVHVDHIVPLNHPLVCGLHCEDNLQVLFAEDNRAKSNTFEI